MLSENSITLDQMSKRIYCSTQDDAQDEVLAIAMSLRNTLAVTNWTRIQLFPKWKQLLTTAKITALHWNKQQPR